MNARDAWRQVYRLHRGGLRDHALLSQAIAATGETWRGPWTVPVASRMVDHVQRRADLPLRVTVLNGFGSHNPFRASAAQMDSPGWQREERKRRALIDRLAAAGRLELDAGGYVSGVVT
ncbi:hypothetical protein I5E68_09750 [Novosphingobium sp. YJ-S2-02]|uniref:Uncharacterized protein n=1 Tax=Novosphingobium aureum TaxID=2792964 RepID=A0A931ML86_9SPHN|nr:hypothetical protein [Novosphingobium aureum]MBH0113229.1 hypothetical protein [Novosphingobium aureum]